MNELHIETVPTDALIPYARNARMHTPEQIAQVAASIREFGWANPILADEERTVIAGHCRLAAARKLGMVDVPTIALRGLSDSQKKGLSIADKKLATNAGWDEELLRLELEELESLGLGMPQVERRARTSTSIAGSSSSNTSRSRFRHGQRRRGDGCSSGEG